MSMSMYSHIHYQLINICCCTTPGNRERKSIFTIQVWLRALPSTHTNNLNLTRDEDKEEEEEEEEVKLL